MAEAETLPEVDHAGSWGLALRERIEAQTETHPSQYSNTFRRGIPESARIGRCIHPGHHIPGHIQNLPQTSHQSDLSAHQTAFPASIGNSIEAVAFCSSGLRVLRGTRGHKSGIHRPHSRVNASDCPGPQRRVSRATQLAAHGNDTLRVPECEPGCNRFPVRRNWQDEEPQIASHCSHQHSRTVPRDQTGHHSPPLQTTTSAAAPVRSRPPARLQLPPVQFANRL